MSQALPLLSDPRRAWEPYAPTTEAPWDRGAVAHLHRRAGFLPRWEILERDLQAGPAASVDRLLAGEPDNGFESAMDSLAAQLGSNAALEQAQALWLDRMIRTPHPLRERLTLFWHDHFATSHSKVRDVSLMQRQVALLRDLSLGSFSELLTEIGRDPAMLTWLDCVSSRKLRPNENYAREVMELFALGRGRYTEKDIQEAARAFSGSFVVRDRFRFVASEHDDGEKTILGQTGRFRGDDLPNILLNQASCALFLCRKLFRTFVSEVDEPTDELLAPLAEAYRASGYITSVPVALILRSRLFFDPAMRRRRVKSPVELVVGSLRALEVVQPTISPLKLASDCRAMGQSLYAPPSVAGWDDGPDWISTASMIARTRFAQELAASKERFHPEKLAEAAGQSSASRHLASLLVGDALAPSQLDQLPSDPRAAAAVLIALPEFQLA